MKRKKAKRGANRMPADPADRAAWLEGLPEGERRRQEAAIRKRFPPGEPHSWPKWLRTAWIFGFTPAEYRHAHGEANRAERADRLVAEVWRTGEELAAGDAASVAATAARRPPIDVPFAHLPAWKMELPEPGLIAVPPLEADSIPVIVPDFPPRDDDMTDEAYSQLCDHWKSWSPSERFEYGTGASPEVHLEERQEAERIWTAGRLLDEIRTGGVEAAVEDLKYLEEVFARPMPCDAPHRDTLEHLKNPRPGSLFDSVPQGVLDAISPESGASRFRRARDSESLGPYLGRANDCEEYFANARATNVRGRRLRKDESWETRAEIVSRMLLAARTKAHDRLGEDVSFPYHPVAGDRKTESPRMILRHMLFVLGFLDPDNTRDSEEFRAGDRFARIEAAVADARERKVSDAMRLTRSDTIEHAVLAGFAAARLLDPKEIARFEKELRVLSQRRENGAMLAEEGRAAKAPNDAARAKWICSAYRRIRPSKPEGSRGNGAAIRDVVERYQSQTGKSITPKGVREILKRHGLLPARRKGKN
jgi:hypothetical protein